jgi:hypothetical protein
MMKIIQCRLIGTDNAKSKIKSSLFALSGVQDVSLAEDVLRIVYDVPNTNASHLLALIESSDLKVASNVWQKISLFVRRFQDAVIEQEASNEIGWDSFVTEIYVSRYRHRRHGRRDDRAHHWRQYSAQQK